MSITGIRIAERRKELRLTQEELAQRLGYKSKSTINKIEKGINDISQTKLAQFAEVLHTTPAYLMGWDDTAPAPAEDDHIQELLQDLRDNPSIGVLLSASKDLNEEDIQQLAELAKRLRASYRD